MSRKYLVPINLNKNELQNARLQNLASDPSSPVEGQVYYNTTDDTVYFYNGATWVDAGQTGGGSTLTQEQVEDYVGAMFTGNTETLIAVTYNDGDGTVDFVVNDDLSGYDNTTSGFLTSETDPVFAASEAANITAGDNTNLGNLSGTNSGDEPNASTTTRGIVELATNTEATTGTDTARAVTPAALQAALDALVDAAPGTLDTLNELAAALGDDPNFAGTVTTSLAEKLAKADNLSDVASAVTAFNNIKQDATTSVTGAVELATSAEAEARTATTKALTPDSVANFTVKKTFTVGDGTATSYTLTHNLGTTDVVTQVRDATNDEIVECDIENTSTSAVTLTFATAPASSDIKAVVLG